MALINTGDQAGKVIIQRYADDNSTTGLKMPNIQNISPEAIVPLSATITFNDVTNPAPSGGSNGDVWYNQPEDKLYKKVSGVWSLLSDRVINADYVPPVQNLIDCAL